MPPFGAVAAGRAVLVAKAAVFAESFGAVFSGIGRIAGGDGSQEQDQFLESVHRVGSVVR